MKEIIRTLFYPSCFTRWIVFYCCISLNACISKNYDKDTTLVSIGNNRQEIKMSDLYSHIEYIKLETSTNSLIGQIAKIIPFENNLLIVDKSISKLFVFNKEGYFLKTIGSKGGGEGEYIGIEDVTVDEGKQIILLLDETSNRILKYNYDGSYIGDIRLDFMVHEIECIAPGKLVGYADYASNKNYEKEDMRPNLFYWNYEKNQIDTDDYVSTQISTAEVNSPFSALSSNGNATACCFNILTNQLFLLDQNKNPHLYEVSFGEEDDKVRVQYIQKLKERDLDAAQISPYGDEAPTNTLLLSALDCGSYLTFTAINYATGCVYYIAFDTHSAKVLYGKAEKDYPLVNDMDNSLPLIPYGSKDGYVYGLIEPYQVIENTTTNSNALKTIIANLKEDDNPILMIGKTKTLN